LFPQNTKESTNNEKAEFFVYKTGKPPSSIPDYVKKRNLTQGRIAAERKNRQTKSAHGKAMLLLIFRERAERKQRKQKNALQQAISIKTA
jgi:hypothetical protein